MGPKFCQLLVIAGSRGGRRGTYCGEAERVDFDTESRDVLLLKLASQMALHEGGLQNTQLARVLPSE